MNKFFIGFIILVLVFTPSCKHGIDVPNVPEPSENNKAVLTAEEQAILKKFVVGNFSKDLEKVATNVNANATIEGLSNGQDGHTFTDGTVNFFKKNTLQNAKLVGKFDSKNVSLELNYDFVSDDKSGSTKAEDYKDGSYIKFNSNTWKKGTNEFSKFVSGDVASTDGELYNAFLVMLTNATITNYSKGKIITTFDLKDAALDYSVSAISDIKVTTSNVTMIQDMVQKATGKERGEDIFQVVFGKATITYKNEKGEAKTLSLDSSNLVFKSKDDGQTISGVKKGADIKVGGKQVKLSDLFDASLQY